MSDIARCRKCHQSFDRRLIRRYKSEHLWSRDEACCPNCSRDRRIAYKMKIENPVETFFNPHSYQPIHCGSCEPWEGRGCAECMELWQEVVADNSMAVA